MAESNMDVPELVPQTPPAYEIRDEYNLDEQAWYAKAETWVIVAVLAVIVVGVALYLKQRQSNRHAPGREVNDA